MDGTDDNQENRVLKAYVSCRDGLFRSVFKMCARKEDVDDILQETYVRVLSASEKRHISSPQDYLFVVSRNLVIERLSRQSREINMEINDAMMGVDEVSTDRELHYRQKFEVFNDALRALPEKQRHAILLRKFYGLSHKEIAKKMKVSVSSVEKYISGGLKQCKKRLGTKGYDSTGYGHIQQARPQQDSGHNVGVE